MTYNITKVKRGRGNKWHLYVDNEYALTLHADVLAQHGLPKGAVEKAHLAMLNTLSREKFCLEHAMRLISIKDRSEQKLYRRLLEDYPETAAAKAVAKLKELDLVDDRRFAAAAAQFHSARGYGARRTFRYLLEQGVGKNIAEEAVAALDEESTEQALRRLIGRMNSGALDTPEHIQKTVGALLRRGFLYADIRSALEKHLTDSE